MQKNLRKILFQSTLPARGATIEDPDERAYHFISIHAPRTGSDFCLAIKKERKENFNPRSPHGERRVEQRIFGGDVTISIHAPRTGSDKRREANFSRENIISIHAPRTGSDGYRCVVAKGCQISIHAPRTGSDGARSSLGDIGRSISIHAPRTGSDRILISWSTARKYFNPRSPHGERHALCGVHLRGGCISIHAPRTGSDGGVLRHLGGNRDFNPRSPHGERRLAKLCRLRQCAYFNPRSPHGERLRKVTILSIRIIGFAQKVYHKTVLLRISLAENAVILPEKPRNPVRTSLQKAGGLRFARAIRAAHPYSISSPSGA